MKLAWWWSRQPGGVANSGFAALPKLVAIDVLGAAVGVGDDVAEGLERRLDLGRSVHLRRARPTHAS